MESMQQSHIQMRPQLGRMLLALAVSDCLVGVAGFIYLNVLHPGEVLAGVTPMGTTALRLMWASWWLSVAGLAAAFLAVLSRQRSRDLWLSIAVNAVYVLPLALLLATRELNLTDRV
jgi:hypothetical protein